jgi:hypothetical protein
MENRKAKQVLSAGEEVLVLVGGGGPMEKV